MSSTDIPEIMIISDDDEEPQPPPAKEPVVVQPVAHEPTKPQVESKDDDSDCEITEITYASENVKQKTDSKKVSPPVEVPVSQEPINADSDSEISEVIIVEDKPTEQAKAAAVETHEKPESPKDATKMPEVEGAKERVVLVAKRKRPFKSRKCCNMDCTIVSNLENMEKANNWDTTFFSVPEGKHGLLWVCKKCKVSSDECYQEALRLGREGKPMIEAATKIKKLHTVNLDDSDEERESADSDESNPDDEELEVDMDMLNELIQSVKADLNLDKQAQLTEELVKKKIATTKDDLDEFEASFKELQKKVDSIRTQLYSPWNPLYQELPAIDVDMDGNAYAHSEWVEVRNDPKTPPRPQQPVATKSTAAHRMVAMKKVTQMGPKVKTYPAKQPDLMEVVDLGQVECPKPQEALPIIGNLERRPPSVGDVVYAIRGNLFTEWLRARIVDVLQNNTDGVLSYRVKFTKNTVPSKVCTAKQLAYFQPPKVQLNVGTRVIAVFHNTEDGPADPKQDHFYAGIIAEPLKTINNHRYLIFFDDGFTQYVSYPKVRVVMAQSREVWEDCHPDSQEFTKEYVMEYPERPMVKLQVGQVVKTEWNTRWWLARVREVDCSLVLMHFDADNRIEWIYRGSMRLGPLYSEMSKKNERQKKGERSRLHRSFNTASRRNAPYIEYTRGISTEDTADPGDERRNLSRSVAKKSTCARLPEPTATPLPSDRRENIGEILRIDLRSAPPRLFKPHQCSPDCIGKESFQEGQRVLSNALLIPLANGWTREVAGYKPRNHIVFYRTPCGRRLRNMSEVHRFLRITHSKLGVDLFTYDSKVEIHTVFQVKNPLYSITDISYEKENVVIPCVNTINHHEYPAYVEYLTQRKPTGLVFIDTDPGFMVCCDCTDGCQNLSKCACRQLTLEEARLLHPQVEPEKVGYSYGRFHQPERSYGVFECNAQCKCSKTCLNRLVQHPMKVQLQLFKTEKRGWGIRTLNDLAAGTFLCIYAGQVLTEQEGNEEGKLYGDEYLAELDYIETMEMGKEGYESDVTDIEADSDSEERNSELKGPEHYSEDSQDAQLPQKNSDDEFHVDHSVTKSLGEPTRSMTLRQRNKKDEQSNTESNSSSVQQAAHKQQVVAKKKTGEVRAPRAHTEDGARKSTRWLIQGNTDIYVMDAKGIGNIGRYFNHSCDPNVFVQNVFVDSHDPRFPWVAFFTSQLVKAGGELCWNYNYEIGSLPGRKLDCYCETAICKGRLL